MTIQSLAGSSVIKSGEKICQTTQPLIWKRQHPQGRLFPVRELFDFDRQLLTPITGDLMATFNQSKKGC